MNLGAAALSLRPNIGKRNNGNTSMEPIESSSLASEEKKRKRKSPAVPWKKPKGMPKRPLSAYNLFFRAERERLKNNPTESDALQAPYAAEAVASAASATAEGKTSRRTSPFVTAIAAKWNTLESHTRAPYEQRAAIDKARYDREIAVWREQQKKVAANKASASPATGSEPDDADIEEDLDEDDEAVAALMNLPLDMFDYAHARNFQNSEHHARGSNPDRLVRSSGIASSLRDWHTAHPLPLQRQTTWPGASSLTVTATEGGHHFPGTSQGESGCTQPLDVPATRSGVVNNPFLHSLRGNLDEESIDFLVQTFSPTVTNFPNQQLRTEHSLDAQNLSRDRDTRDPYPGFR